MTKSEKTERLRDEATRRLFKDSPKALAIQTAGRKLKREQNRREWYAKHGGAK
jgi:hypothetical protein